jgi:hypothetical protein
MTIKGKFEGQLHVELQYSPRDQTYKVVVWEWRKPHWSTETDNEATWRNPSLGVFYDDWKDYGDKLFDHRKPWKRREQATRYFAKVKAEQAFRHVSQITNEESRESWQKVAS